MRHSMKLIVPTIAVSVLLAACGSSSSNSASSNTTSAPAAAQTEASSGAVVKTATMSSLGKTVLVNAQGMTLYALSGERNGKFICTSSACVGVWHPLTVPAGTTPSGTVGSLSVVKRSDGTTQVTYKGQPLYTFAQDHAAGEDNGQGIKDVGTWNAVAASGEGGTTVTATTSSPSPGAGGGGGGGYGY
jgi:predicted lipoprotein with Yx(FWY)xxD motif